MKHLAILVILMQVIFISCNKEDDIIENKKEDSSEKKEPGYFVLTELKNSVKSSTIDSEKKQMEISGGSNMTFSLDGNGTIADNNRIQLGNDGKGYFRVSTKLISW